MPLSEQEQRMLDEMERNLLRTDADVVSASPTRGSLNYRNLVLGAVLVIVGLASLVAGVAMFQSLGAQQFIGIIVGIVGFVAMFFGVILAMRPGVKAPDDLADAFEDMRREAKATTSKQTGFMDRMNDRWDRRQHPGE